jgi:hypothetical protein
MERISLHMQHNRDLGSSISVYHEIAAHSDSEEEEKEKYEIKGKTTRAGRLNVMMRCHNYNRAASCTPSAEEDFVFHFKPQY